MMPPSEPDLKRRTQRLDFTLGAVAVLILLLVVVQLFLRYAYVHTTGNKVVRVDRLTGESCLLPCQDNGSYGPYYAAYTPPATPRPDKVCHTADVVRVLGRFMPSSQRTPTPYGRGGFQRSIGHRRRFTAPVHNAVELTDGHVYVFSADTYQNDVATWSTGQEIDVCATWSKLEHRPFYSVGPADEGEGDPATLAI